MKRSGRFIGIQNKKNLLDRPALIFPRILTSFARRVMITIRLVRLQS